MTVALPSPNAACRNRWPVLASARYRYILSHSFKAPVSHNIMLAIVVAVCAIPARAETKELSAGRYVASAAFPCTSQLQEPLTYKTDVGDVSQTSLMCSQGNIAYALTMTEFPRQLVEVLSRDEMLDSTLDDARSKSYMKIESSTQTRYRKYPVLRAHLLDARKPESETFAMNVLVDRYMISAQVVAAKGQAESKSTTDFLNSVKIDLPGK